MSNVKVKERKDNCESCHKAFGVEIKYHAMNMCFKCYMISKKPQYTPKKRVNSKEAYTNCVDCGNKFGDLGKRGRPILYASNGLCKTCYSRAYYNRQERECLKCGCRIQSSTKTLCRVCHELEKDEYYKNNPKAKKDASYKQKLKVLKNELTTEQYELIRRLLVRFKLGMSNYADFFRVADIYVDIYSHESHLDAYSEHDQVTIMLKRLKDIFDHNTIIFKERAIKEKEKLDRKRKRLLKV